MKTALPAVTLLALALAACDGVGPDSETVGGVEIAIDAALKTPMQSDTAITIALRYRDFAAPGAGAFDPQELGDPAWSIDRSNYATQVEIARRPAPMARSAVDLHNRHPGLTAVGSDWQPWRRFKECPIGCEHVFYLNEAWNDRGLGYIECEFVENRNPFLIACTAHDTIEGLQVTYTFPAAQKERFPEFREKIAAFLQARIAGCD